MKNKIFRQQGFTLIEMLLTLGVLSILLVFLSGVYAQIVDVQNRSKSLSFVDEDGQYIIARLQHDMELASSITLPATAGAQTNSLQIVINSVNYTYNLNNLGNLQIINNYGTNNLNSVGSSISGVLFKRIGSGGNTDTVQVNFTIKGLAIGNSGLTEARTYQTTLGLQ